MTGDLASNSPSPALRAGRRVLEMEAGASRATLSGLDETVSMLVDRIAAIVDMRASTADAILAMSARRFACVGVVNEHSALVGITTDGDLRRHMNTDMLARPVCEVMTAEPRSLRPQALAAEALALMNHAEMLITVIFVTVDRRPVGILHIHDCLRSGVA